MKVAIITGGSQGLGKEILNLLEQDQWTVFDISRTGQSAHHLTYDLNDVTHLGDLWKTLSGQIAQIEIEEIVLISNAGLLAPIRRMGNHTAPEILSSAHINVVAPLIIIHAFIQSFRNLDTPKAILNISSGAAHKGYAGWSLYCAGKAALDNCLNALYEEEKSEPHPFRVVNVNPAVMDTAMQEQIRHANEQEFPQKPRFVKLKADQQLLPALTVAKAIQVLIYEPHRTDLQFDVRTVVAVQP